MTEYREEPLGQRRRSGVPLDARSHVDRAVTPEAQFLHWARQSLRPIEINSRRGDKDLAALGEMIGDAPIVALSEGIHCAAEPIEFRNRVLQYLVREKGFTAIAIESGLVESRVLHDYVRGGPGELDSCVAQGLGMTFDKLPQNVALIRWLRQYNTDPETKCPVNFYGFDVPGSPGNERANRGIDTGLVEALEYLARVDARAHAALQSRIGALLTKLRFGIRKFTELPCYEQWTQAERDTLTGGIEDLIGMFERNEGRYIGVTSPRAYAWAHRAAIGARQTDTWLRQIPLGWEPVTDLSKYLSEQIGFLSAGTDVRDRAQADNIEWILAQEGACAKILLFGHRYHLSAAPVKAAFWVPGDEDREHEVAGTFLRRRFGSRLVTIGHMFGKGEARCGEFRQVLERAPNDFVDGLLGEAGESQFLLDMRSAPAALHEWLARDHWLAHGRQVFRLSLRRAYDVLFYVDVITPACGMVSVHGS